MHNGYEDRDEEVGGGQYGRTSDFSTTLLGKDGRFFGIKLSKDTANTFNMMYGTILPWLSSKGADAATPVAHKFAEKVLHADAIKATKFANRTADAVAYGIIFGKQLFEVGTNIYDSTQSLNELRVAVKPLANAGGAATSVSALSGNNEVVSNARTKIKDIFMKRIYQMVTGSVATLPALMDRIAHQPAENAKRLEANEQRAIDLEWEKHKNDPEKSVELLEKRARGLAHNENLSEHDVLNSARIEVAEKKWKERLAAYKKTEHATAVRKELDELLAMTGDQVMVNLEQFQHFGIGTHFLTHRSEMPSIEEIEKFQQQNKANIEKILDRKLRQDFIEKEGAFDRNKVIRDANEMEHRHGRYRDYQGFNQSHGHSYGHDHDKNKNPLVTAKSFLATLTSEILTDKLIGKKFEKYAQPIALDRILHLRKVVEQGKHNPPERVPDMSGRSDMSYTMFVHEIFQQHQRDGNHTEIGRRSTEHLEKAGWDDAAILQLPDEELNVYEHAIKSIAKRIKDGRMDAIALIDLVGDRKNKIVRSDGRSFGPLGMGRDEKEIKATIDRIIDDKTEKLRADQKQTDAQINEKLGDFIFSVQDLKTALESKETDIAERAFVYTVFSEIVGSDEQLVKLIGVSKERVQQLRAESKAHYTEHLDGAVKALSEMIENDPEKLRKDLKITEKEQQLLLAAVEQINAGKHVMDSTEHREDLKSIETVVANAAMTLSKAKDGKENFWQRLVTATKELRQPKPAKEEAAEEMLAQAPERMDRDEPMRHERQERGGFTDGLESKGDTPFAEKHRHQRLNGKEGKGAASSEFTQAM